MNKRLSALIAGGAAVAAVIGLAPSAPAVTTVATNGNAYITADWLAGELSSAHLMYNPNYGGFNDYGLSIDAAFALNAAGGHDATVQSIRSAIIANIDHYTTGADYGFADEVVAGATAKAAVLEQIGGSASSSLISQLDARVATAAPIVGRIQDSVNPSDQYGGDYANVFGQAFAAQALNAASDSNTANVTDFLLKQQCSSGYFRQSFTADKTAVNQSCVNGTDQASVDTTAQAILSLLPRYSSPAIATAVDSAVAWLKSVQQTGGGFTDTGAAGTANTNSTGLAGYALGQAGSTAEAAKAAAWIKAVVVTPGIECSSPKLLGEFGAVAKSAADLTSAKSTGITDATADGFRRATAPALEALTYLASPNPVTTARVNNPVYVQAGKATTIGVGGLAAGEDNCFYDQFGGTRAANGKATIYVAGGRQVFYLDHYGPTMRTVVGALGARTFVLSLTRGTLITPGGPQWIVRTKGLAPGEAYSVYFRGAKVATGKASSVGAATASFIDIGPNTAGLVTFKGQFGTRNGYFWLS